MVDCGRLNEIPPLVLLFRELVEVSDAPGPNSRLVVGGLLSVLMLESAGLPNRKVDAGVVLDAGIENSEPVLFEVLELSTF